MKDFFDVLDFEFSFFHQIAQVYRGLCDGITCRELILGNLIQVNKELFEKKIDSFLKKVQKSNSWRKNKVIRPIREISIICRNSINENDDSIERLEGNKGRMRRNSKIYRGMHHRSSSNVPDAYYDHRGLMTGNSYANNDTLHHLTLTKHSSLVDCNRNRKSKVSNDYRDNGRSDDQMNTKNPNVYSKTKINDASAEMLLIKFHTILNQYNNQLSDEESLLRNKQISEGILNNAKKKRGSLYSVKKKRLSTNSP